MVVEHDEKGREVYASLTGAPDGWYVGSEHTLWFVRARAFGLADDVGTVRSFRTRRDDRWAPYLRAPVVPEGFAGSHHHDRRWPVALAAITHPDGGWVLAADWTETKEGER